MTKRIKIVLGSILLITLAILFLHLFVKEPKLSELDFTREVSVVNRTDNQSYGDIVYAGLQVLNIEHVYVSIFPLTQEVMDRFSWEQGAELKALVLPGASGTSQYAIYVIPMNPSRALQVIAHELIHLKQMEEGRLSIVSVDSIIWEPLLYDRIFSTVNTQYQHRPWEQEAMKDDGALAREIRILLTPK